MHDLVVVGAGIVGLAVAREWLARRHADNVVVVERENAPAQHQTGRNSGVIHGGVYYQPGSLKARLCVEGARLMYRYCDDNAIPYERCGKLIVALDTDELPRLNDVVRRDFGSPSSSNSTWDSCCGDPMLNSWPTTA